MSDQPYKQDIEQGRFGSARGVANSVTLARAENTFVIEYLKAAADAMASTATAETLCFGLPTLPGYADGDPFGILYRVDLTTDANATQDAANYATITFNKRDATGANPLAIATYATQTAQQGTLTAWDPKAGVITSANAVVVAGGAVTVSIAKSGTGVVVPIYKAKFYFQKL